MDVAVRRTVLGDAARGLRSAAAHLLVEAPSAYSGAGRGKGGMS